MVFSVSAIFYCTNRFDDEPEMRNGRLSLRRVCAETHHIIVDSNGNKQGDASEGAAESQDSFPKMRK